MKPLRQSLATGALAALSLGGCAETSSELFAERSGTPPSGDGTLRLDEAGDILDGPVIGDCSRACGNSGFGGSEVIAGDLDADGYDDILLNVPGHSRDLSRDSPGGVYVVYGRPTWADDATVAPDAILELDGRFGGNTFALARAGDVDGDGHDDFLVGDNHVGICSLEALEPGSAIDQDDLGFGRAYLVYGGPARLSGVVPIADVASTFVDETPCKGLGAAVSSAGDLDGDGFGDFVLGGDPGAPYVPDRVGEGRAYLFYGSGERRPAMNSVATADATLRGGSDVAGFGRGLASAGDVDGDGDGDLLISENLDVIWYIDGEEVVTDSATYLVAGGDRMAGDVDATASPAIAIFKGKGHHGLRSAGLGDLDEDGLDDFALDGWGGNVGDDIAAFIFYGRADGFAPSVDASSADIILREPLDLDYGLASPLAAAGDRDGDGHRDIIIGRYNMSDPQGGASVIGGTGARWTGDFLIDDIATSYVGSRPPPFPSPPFSVEEDPWRFDHAGLSVAGDGDIDGDGTADLIVGAPGTDSLGRVYLLRGPDGTTESTSTPRSAGAPK